MSTSKLTKFFIEEVVISEIEAPDAQTAINEFLKDPKKYFQDVSERNISDAEGEYPDCDTNGTEVNDVNQ